IAPDQSARVSGRLLAPAWPGVYWLQWDMVEEGVTWFSQVSPREKRTLVIVLPTLFAVLTPLPLLTAWLGIYLTGRDSRPRRRWWGSIAAESDALWAAAALFCKPFLIINEALLEPQPVADWLMIVWAIVPVLVLVLAVGRRGRRWPLFAAVV